MRAEMGLPPETPEEKAARRAKQEQSREHERVEAEAARQRVEAERAARGREQQEIDTALQAALSAADPMEFQRQAARLSDGFDRLTESQRLALDAKLQGMAERSVIGTPAEITAMNALAEKMGRWKRNEREREKGRAKVFRVVDGRLVESGLAADPASSDAKPAPKPKPAEPPSVVDQFLKLFRRRS